MPADEEFARLTHDVFASHTFGHLQRAYTFLPKTDALPCEVAVRINDLSPMSYIYAWSY